MSTALTPLRVETAFWLILCGGLAAGIGLETNWGRQQQGSAETIVETRAEFSEPALAEPFRLPPADQYVQITARPIFVVTRRPAPISPTSESAKSSMKKDQFILMGTTIAGGSKVAFLVEKVGNRNRVVAQGKEINGITVREVTADRVVLSQFGETETLLLKTNRPPPGTPARPVGVVQNPFLGVPATPPAVPNPFLGPPATPPVVQNPFLAAPAAPAGAQSAPPPVGFPAAPK